MKRRLRRSTVFFPLEMQCSLNNAVLKFLKFRISDENQDPLSYKVYLVYRNNDSEITNGISSCGATPKLAVF